MLIVSRIFILVFLSTVTIPFNTYCANKSETSSPCSTLPIVLPQDPNINVQGTEDKYTRVTYYLPAKKKNFNNTNMFYFFSSMKKQGYNLNLPADKEYACSDIKYLIEFLDKEHNCSTPCLEGYGALCIRNDVMHTFYTQDHQNKSCVPGNTCLTHEKEDEVPHPQLQIKKTPITAIATHTATRHKKSCCSTASAYFYKFFKKSNKTSE